MVFYNIMKKIKHKRFGNVPKALRSGDKNTSKASKLDQLWLWQRLWGVIFVWGLNRAIRVEGIL